MGRNQNRDPTKIKVSGPICIPECNNSNRLGGRAESNDDLRLKYAQIQKSTQLQEINQQR